MQDDDQHSIYEDVYSVLLQPPCTFRDVMGVQITVNTMCQLLVSLPVEKLRVYVNKPIIPTWICIRLKGH